MKKRRSHISGSKKIERLNGLLTYQLAESSYSLTCTAQLKHLQNHEVSYLNSLRDRALDYGSRKMYNRGTVLAV